MTTIRVRRGRAFEQLGLAAAHHETAAKAGDAGRCERPIRFVAGGIGHVDLGDDESGHRVFLSVNAEIGDAA